MQPLFIGNYELGSQTNLKPFYLPEQAFETVNNMVVFRGRLLRRPGYDLLGRLQRERSGTLTAAIAGGAYTTAPGTLLTVFTLEATSNITPGSITLSTFGVGYQFSDFNLDGKLIATTGGGYYDAITGVVQGVTTTINMVTNASQIGDQIWIDGMTGMTELNGQYFTVVGSTGASVDIAVDSTLFPAWTGGGIVQAVRGSVNYATGALSITFNALFNGQALTIVFDYYPGLPVMGLRTRELNTLEVQATIAFDTIYSYTWNGTEWQQFGTATWTGNDTDFFWTTNYWRDTTGTSLFWATNFNWAQPGGGDNIRYYNNALSSWVTFVPYISADQRQLQSCLMLIPYKGRLLAFNTWEGLAGGPYENFKQRVRWSSQGDPTVVGTIVAGAWTVQGSWASDIVGKGGFLDAPTSEEIVSAGFVKDQLIVYFERSTWQLLYTGNEILPFIWQRINAELGCESTFSNVQFDNGLIALGPQGIHSCNGQSVTRIDELIPTTVFDVNTGENGIQRVYAIRDFWRELVYFSYPDNSRLQNNETLTYPNRVLCYNYKNNSWSFWDVQFTCWGTFQPNVDTPWNALKYDSWNDWGDAWNSGITQAEALNIVAGNQQGFVFILTPDEILDDGSFAIQSFTNSGTTVIINSPSHQLRSADENGSGDAIQINDTIAASGLMQYTFEGTTTNLNGTIAFVNSVLDDDNFTILGNVTGTYMGGGVIEPIARIDVWTKQFNPFWNAGRRCRLTKIKYLFDNSKTGEVCVNAYDSTDFSISMSEIPEVGGIPNDNLSLWGTEPCIVLTRPEPNLLTPGVATFATHQQQIWHTQYTQVEGDTFQLNITMSDSQLQDFSIFGCDVELHAMILYFEPAGDLA